VKLTKDYVVPTGQVTARGGGVYQQGQLVRAGTELVDLSDEQVKELQAGGYVQAARTEPKKPKD